VLPNPLSGVCSRSSDQWTAGLLSQLQLLNGACFDDNRINDTSSTLFETPPLTRQLPFLGPIDARLYVSSNTGDGMLSVAVSDVAPDGSVKRLTGGWQVISLRELDAGRTRYLDGKVLQPYHPFTKASAASAEPGEVVPVDVEVFPTGAAIQPGHRLRLSVQAFDVPHLAPTLPGLPGTLTTLTVHSSPAYPSALVLPTRDRPAPAASAPPVATSAVSPAATHRSARLRLRIDGHRLVVRLPGAVRGVVRVRLDRRNVGAVHLHHGRAALRLPHATRGRHLIRVTCRVPGRATLTASRTWRVR